MFKTWAARYALFGFAFGLIFPIADTLAELARHGLPVTLDAIVLIQFGPDSGIDRWLIDAMAPVLAGLLGLIGDRRDRRERDIRHLRRLADLRSALSASAGIESLLNTLAPKWAELIGARACTFAAWDDRSQRPVPLHPRCPFDEAAAAAPSGDDRAPLVKWVIDQRQVGRASAPPVLAVPLAVNQQAFAAAVFTAPFSANFDPRDEPDALAAADQVALAIDHLRAGAEIRRRARDMEAISHVARRIAAGWDIDRILTTVAESAQVRFGMDYVGILTVDAAAGEFIMRAQAGPLAREEALTHRQKISQGLSAQVYATGQLVLTRDVRGEPIYIGVAGPDTRSELILPLRSGETVIGLMAFASRHVDGLGDDDVGALQLLADQVAVAIDNARLYDDAQNERQRLSAVLASTGDAVVMIDAADRVQVFNRAAERLFGVTAAQAVGVRLDDALRLPQLIAAYRAAPPDAHVFELALDDAITLLGNLTPVRDESLGRLGRVLVLHDISDIKRLDQLKSQMIRMASHDLRNPLNMAFGYLDLIEDATADRKDKIGAYIDGLNLGLRRMRKLIEDLLDVERIESAAERVREPVDVNEVARRAVDELRAQAEAKRHQLGIQVTDAPARVRADPVQIQQVAVNLLSNAIKYTPGGGRIDVRVRHDGDRVVFEVEDNGLGIPGAAQAKLFQRFYRVKTRGTEGIEGTGLGLSLVKAVVDQHAGTIEVDSDEGRGSLFRVRLPAITEN